MFKLRSAIFLIICFIGMLLVSCDRDCGTLPTQKDSGYNFYTYRMGSSNDDSPRVYIWNSSEQKLTDSIFIDSGFSFSEVEVTADESHLLISSGGGFGYPARTRILDLATRLIIKDLPYGGGIKVSSNGNYIAIQAQPFHIIDGITFNDILTDTLLVGGGEFDSSGNTFFAIHGINLIYRYDIANRLRLPDIEWRGQGFLKRLMPNADGTKLFLHAGISNQIGEVTVFDIIADTTRWIKNTGGTNFTYFERTPDCKTILFTDPEDPFDALSSRTVNFIDIATEHIVVSVPYPFAGPNSADPMFSLTCTEIAISPDGQTAVFASLFPPWQGVIDVNEHLFTDFFRIDSLGSDYGWSVSCGKNL